MEDGDDLGVQALHAVHDPQRVQDVGEALLVHLALVGTGGDLDRLLNGRHGHDLGAVSPRNFNNSPLNVAGSLM